MLKQFCLFLPRNLCNSKFNKKLLHDIPTQAWNMPPPPELDLDYIFAEKNTDEILRNIGLRKSDANFNLIKNLKNTVDRGNTSSEDYGNTLQDLYKELLKIPNKTHPAVANLSDDPHIIKTLGEKRIFEFAPRDFDLISRLMNLVRSDQLGSVCGSRSYALLGEMAELEQALIKFTLRRLIERNFTLISVPDIVHRDIIEGCGVNTRGKRTMVYTLDPKMHESDLCLSGTSEMALAGHFINKVVSRDELPLKLAAVSRCFRAEVSNISEEKGMYRVHQFTKVEMFALSGPQKSDQLLEELREIEEETFSLLGLHIRTLDMPPHELGPPAYRKYDIEAWLPGRNMFGEISSCSNCTDYQARRLNIKYETQNGLKHVHTLNGTACAIPRMLIALIETYQTDRGVINIPDALQMYMNGKTGIRKQKHIPPLKLLKNKKSH